MRVLLYCPRCKRQVDGSAVPVGEALRCRCGNEIEVPRARAGDAVVVRCSSCGAPREDGAPSCVYCGADFTARERDENTLCPVCFARIGDRARFCSACGATVAPEEDAAAAATDRVCPVCGGEHRLASRALGASGFSALECERCSGLWLGEEVFQALAEKARAEEDPDPSAPGIREQPAARAPAPYRRCPVCGTMMNRRNFGRRSGVLLDECRDHGTWFDASELQQVLTWIRRGGETLAAERDKEEERATASAARFRVEPRAPDEAPFSPPDREGPEEMGLLGVLTHLLLKR